MARRRKTTTHKPPAEPPPPRPAPTPEPAPGNQPAVGKFLTYTSLVASLAAVALTGFMYVDQRSANVLTRDRYNERYAARVAAWTGHGKNSGFVFVQNRSLTPLSGAFIVFRHAADPTASSEKTSAGIPRVDGKSSIHLVPGIGPCAVVKAEKPKLDNHVTYVDHMYFADAQGRWWKKGLASTTLIQDTDKSGDPTAIETMQSDTSRVTDALTVISDEAAEDCTDA